MLDDLQAAVIDGDSDEAGELAAAALAAGTVATALVDGALVPAMVKVAELWQAGEYFMSDVILSANAFGVAMAVVAPALQAAGVQTHGKIVIGVVEGDLHDLGKDIVVAMLRANGFAVVDLGIDVPTASFVEAVQQEKPDILGIGAYMSTTLLIMQDVIAAMEAAGLRDGLKIIVGGVCVNEVVADTYGADGYGKDALATVALAKEYLEVQ